MAKLKAPEANSGLTLDQIAPAGQHLAVCLRVNDIFNVERQKFQSQEMEIRDVTRFIFGLKDAAGRLLLVQTYEFTISAAPGSNLIKFLTQWLGTAPQMGWDYAEMLGRGAMLTVQHKQSKRNVGQTYADIVGIAPVFPQLLAQVPAAAEFEAMVSALEKGGAPAAPGQRPAGYAGTPPPPLPPPAAPARQLSPDGKFELVNNQWVPVAAALPPPPPAPVAPPPPPVAPTPPPPPAAPLTLSPDGKWKLVNNQWVPHVAGAPGAPAGGDEDVPF